MEAHRQWERCQCTWVPHEQGTPLGRSGGQFENNESSRYLANAPSNVHMHKSSNEEKQARQCDHELTPGFHGRLTSD